MHCGAAYTIWVQCVLYVRWMAPYGSPLRRVGAILEPELAVWEPHVPYRSHLWVWEVDDTTWGQHAPYAGHMGAMCTVQEPHGTI
jgi:hypothetical protein